jgi:hypothetical protein
MKSTCIPLCLAALVLPGCGGGQADEQPDKPKPAAARRAASAPIEVALKSAHRSGVRGTATLVQGLKGLEVTVKLSKPVEGNLLAHIHTGPCSDEPTMNNPRIWASLTDVVDGRSETTVDLMTLHDLRAESTSINVHDPEHANRPLVCGDIPPAEGSTR